MDKTLDRTIGRIYEAVSDHTRWSDVVLDIEQLTAGVAANVQWYSGTGKDFIITSEEYRDAGKAYLSEGMLLHDPRIKVTESLPPDRMFLCHEHFDVDAVRRDLFYQEFLLPNRLRFTMGGMQRAGDDTVVVAVHRSLGAEPFTTADAAIVQKLRGHIARAFSLRQVLALRDHSNAVLSAVLDCVSVGVAVLAPDCRIICLNRLAEEALRSGQPLGAHQGRMVLADSLAHQRFRTAVATATETARRSAGAGGTSMLVRGAAGRVFLQIMPVNVMQVGHFQEPSAVVVLSPEPRTLPVGRMLCDLFRLTAAEARVAVELACGASLAELAKVRGVRQSTLRSQLKAILEKTDSRRQSDVVRLVLLLAQTAPPLRR